MLYQTILTTNQDRSAFIKGLIRLAKADGQIQPEEQAYFMQAAAELGTTESEQQEISRCLTASAPIPVQFTSRPAALLFLREGIQLCSVDESYDENEQTEIRVLAAELRIPEETVLRLEEWVQRGMAWRHEGDALLEL